MPIYITNPNPSSGTGSGPADYRLETERMSLQYYCYTGYDGTSVLEPRILCKRGDDIAL
jgi:hypothetical protein